MNKKTLTWQSRKGMSIGSAAPEAEYGRRSMQPIGSYEKTAPLPANQRFRG